MLRLFAQFRPLTVLKSANVPKWIEISSWVKHYLPKQLYNLAEDRSEINNLSEKYPEKLQELKALYNKWAKEVGAKVRK